MLIGAEIGHDWPSIGIELKIISDIFLRKDQDDHRAFIVFTLVVELRVMQT